MDFRSLSLALIRRADAACDRFEAAWREGRRPCIEQFLEDSSEPERIVLLRALLESELELRCLHGERPEPKEYLERFPGDPTLVESAFGDLAMIHDRSARSTDSDTARGPEDEATELREAPAVAFQHPTRAIGGRFRILRHHARGGLGEVYVALDSELSREVALKQIQDGGVDDPESRARFLLEAEITGALEHPGIVPVYSVGIDRQGRPFYAMRLVRGETLAEAIRKFHEDDGSSAWHPGARLLSLRRLLAHLVDACNAVAYAHSRGVVHRDLKPQNILLGPFGETLVVDWGLAKAVGQDPDPREPGAVSTPLRPSARNGIEATAPGSPLGTPAYMSPEQTEGRLDQIGPRSDVYSLGVTLYQLLTSRRPFTGIDRDEVLRQVSRGEFPPPRSINRTVAPALDAVCRKAMALRPEDRYGSPRQLADDIERWLADEPVDAWREPLVLRARRRIARHGMLLTAATASIIGAAVLSVGVGFWIRRERDAHTARRTRLVADALSEASQERGRAQAPGVDVADLAHLDRAVAAARRAEALLAEGEVDDVIRSQGAILLAELTDERADALQAAERAQRDRRLLARLAELHTLRGGDFDAADPEAEHSRAFRDHGLLTDGSTPEQVAAEIRARPPDVARAVVGALDDWAALRWSRTGGTAHSKFLIKTARLADPDPWRDDLRATLLDEDSQSRRKNLVRLATSARPEDLPAASVSLLGRALFDAGEPLAAATWLRSALRRYPEEAWLHYNLAIALRKAIPPEPDEVILHFTAARALRPESAHELAHALEGRGRSDEAIAVLRDLARRRPDVARHDICLATALTQAGNAEEAGRRRERAIALLREAIRVQPDNATDHLLLGLALRGQSDVDGAIAAYTRAIQLRPADATAHMNLGAVLSDLKNDCRAAIAEFREAIRLQPDDARTRFNLALTLERQGNRAAAITEFREAVRLQPDDVKTHIQLAVLLKAEGDVTGAIAEFRAAIRLSPEDVRLHNDLGLALAEAGDLSTAISEYDEALRLRPDHQSAHFNRGLALANQGKMEGAVAGFREAIRLQPDDAYAHYNLGLALKKQGDVRGAIEAYRAAIRFRPEMAAAHNNLANALDDLGDLAGAVAAYREANRIQPGFFTSHYNLAIALATSGDVAGAIVEDEAAIRLRPGFALAHCKLGQLLERQGRFAEALVSLRKGHELGSRVPGWSYPSSEWVREGERLAQLDGRLPAILAGEDRPSDIDEHILYAQICAAKRLYAASTRLYEQALTSWLARLTADPRRGHRYDAACAAVLAATGTGQADPPEAERARLRTLARDWLTADLAAWSDWRDSDAPKARDVTRGTLKHWQVDPDLGGVRDPAGLARLPEAEVKAWTAFWSKVDRLLRRTDPAFSRPHGPPEPELPANPFAH